MYVESAILFIFTSATHESIWVYIHRTYSAIHPSTMDSSTITYYSIPLDSIDRTVCFNMDISRGLDVTLWNDPNAGHVFHLAIASEETVWLSNKSNESMALCGFNNTSNYSFYVGAWQAYENKQFSIQDILQGNAPEYFFVFNDIPSFKITGFIYRKKASAGYYTCEETVILPKGIYKGIGCIAAALNQQVSMRGERNGYIYHFITHKGKLSMEASHKQPEPSFMEVSPMNAGLGLVEQSVLRLRTKERIDFEYNVVSMM